MNIGELFVNLGIKGADKTVGALGSVKKGLGEVSSMSLEAKAAILAAMYGLERMMAVSGAAGVGLTNFAALTGISIKSLQQWQYAAGQAGESSEEFTSSLKAVQNSMNAMRFNKGAPEGFAFIKNAVGLDTSRLQDTIYVMGQLDKAMRALPIDAGNLAGKSFGLSEGTIAAMRKGVFNPANFARAPMYSDREAESLTRSSVAWSNLGRKIEMAFGHFNAKHGQSLVADISKIVTAVARLAEALEILSEKLKVFELMAKAASVTAQVFEGWGYLVDDMTTEKKNQLPKGLFSPGALAHPSTDPTNQAYHLAPPMNYFEPRVNATTTIHQNITHHGDAKDTKAVKDIHKQGANSAYRQRPNYVGS